MIEKISLSTLSDQITSTWRTVKLPNVNDNSLRLRVVEESISPWHSHEHSDQLFVVLSGNLTVDTDDGSFELSANELIAVPAGTRHRTRCLERCTVLIMDNISDAVAATLTPVQQ